MQAIQASFVVPVDLPSTLVESGDATTLFAHTTKTFHLHIQSVDSKTTFIDAESITHYTDPPLEAAFTGVFLDGASVRMYLALYGNQHGKPYESDAKHVNASMMLAESRFAFASGVY